MAVLSNMVTPKVEREAEARNYGKFVITPLERGYGVTLGNALRRVLLSSLEGAAITSVKIDGAMHEFTTVEGVVEDVTEIVLNLKKILFKAHSRDPQTLLLSVNKEGAVTAADIQRVAQELLGRPRLALLNGREDSGDLVHETHPVGRGMRAAVHCSSWTAAFNSPPLRRSPGRARTA
mgnify:CR=1 FL=1